MSDYICPFFADDEASDSEEATSPKGSEYSFSMLFRGESADEPATPGARQCRNHYVAARLHPRLTV